MKKPTFCGLSHVCIFVDNVEEAFSYYERILGAVREQYIPHWHNAGFFRAAGFVDEAEQGDVSIGFMNVPGTQLTLELMCYHYPEGRKTPVFFRPNDVSGARHIALKITNIEEAFEYIKAQSDATLVNTTEKYKVYQIGKTYPSDLVYFDEREKNASAKQAGADVLSGVKYFYFIDKYGLQWEFEQGHSDIGA